jgi:protein-S-isoprenylcysteine O-methyltransferase Ste14
VRQASAVFDAAYTGLLSMFLGSALAIGKLGGFVAVAIFLVKCILRVGREEALLTRHFPDEYLEYKSTTSAIVPSLW